MSFPTISHGNVYTSSTLIYFTQCSLCKMDQTFFLIVKIEHFTGVNYLLSNTKVTIILEIVLLHLFAVRHPSMHLKHLMKVLSVTNFWVYVKLLVIFLIQF